MSLMSRLLTLLLPVALVGCAITPQPTVDVAPTIALTIGSANLSVEVADDNAEREQGLSGRERLPENTGMLFVFDEPLQYEFWMKGMRFSLDFLWIAGGKVTEVTQNIPPPTERAPDIVRIRPQQPVDAVIEVTAGWAAAKRITAGAEVTGLPPRVDR